MNSNELSQKDLIELELNRLSEKYKKDYLECDDIMVITGLGRENVRRLMDRSDFPTTKVGRRKVVSLLNFVMWQITNQNK